MNSRFKSISVLALCALFLCSVSIAADDVRLIHGKLYRNVRTKISRNFVTIKFRNGGRIVVPKKSIAMLVNKPHNWTDVYKKTAPHKQIPQKEIRVAALVPEPGKPGDKKLTKKRESRTSNKSFDSCALRSMVAPGWGQYSCAAPNVGHGIIASLLFAGYGMFAVSNRHTGLTNEMGTIRIAALALPRRTFLVPLGYWAYDKSLRLQARRKRTARYYNRLSISMGIVYVIQIIHAYTLDNRVVKSAKQVTGFNLQFAANPGEHDRSREDHGFKASFRIRY